jgi:hypothetical protein
MNIRSSCCVGAGDPAPEACGGRDSMAHEHNIGHVGSSNLSDATRRLVVGTRVQKNDKIYFLQPLYLTTTRLYDIYHTKP